MTDMTADDELGAFRADYRRLLELTDTTEVPSALQPQFVARMLRRAPSEVVDLHTLYERASAPSTGDDGVADAVRRHHHGLRELLSAAQRLGEPQAHAHRFGRRDPIDECDRYRADHERLTTMCTAVDGDEPDSVLLGLGARRADLVALHVLADRIDAGVDPDQLVDAVLDRRPLLDDLLGRVDDELPDKGAAPVPTARPRPAAVPSTEEAAHTAHLESLAFQDSYDWLLELTECTGLEHTTELQELSRRLAVPLDRVIGVRALYDDLIDPATDPLDHAERLQAWRDLLDDLLTRAEDRSPDDGHLAPVVELDRVRARHGGATDPDRPPAPAADRATGALARRIEAAAADTGSTRPADDLPDGPQPVGSHSPGPTGDGRTPDDECDAYTAAFDELGHRTGTTGLDPELQAEALNDLLGVPVADAAALRELAERIRTRFAPRRVLAAEARARLPRLDRLVAAADDVAPSPGPDAPPEPTEETDTGDAGAEEEAEAAEAAEAIDPRMAEFRRMRRVRDDLGLGPVRRTDTPTVANATGTVEPTTEPTAELPAGEERAAAGPGRLAAMSPSRQVAVAVVALIVIVDVVVIGWWLLGRANEGGDDAPLEQPSDEPVGDNDAVGGVPALIGQPGSDADVVASVSGDACHLVALGTFATLAAARDFATDPTTPGELADRSRVLLTTALPGYRTTGYVAVALGENPGDAERLAEIAAESGLETTGPVSLDRPCPEPAP